MNEINVPLLALLGVFGLLFLVLALMGKFRMPGEYFRSEEERAAIRRRKREDAFKLKELLETEIPEDK